MDSPPNIILPSLIGINNQSTAPSASTINNGIPNPTTKTTTTNAASTATKTSSPFNGTSTINSTSFANGRPAATITNPSPPSNSSSPTPPIASSSTISITNGLTASTPPSTANPPSTTTPKPPPDIIIEQMDRFIKAAAFVAYKKFGAKIGIISCKYSFNLLQNNVADYISFNNEGSPSHILAPFYNKDRFVLAVFYGGDKHVGYYDSLKQPSTTDFFLVKYSIEKYLHPLNFVIAGSDFVNSTFNDNPFPRYANFHICRIVEEICFNGRTQLLKPFNIKDEVERIKKIIGMVSDHFWNGEWLPSLKEARVENVIQDVIMDSLSCNNENVLSTSSSSVTVINGEHVQSKTVSDSSPIVVTQSNGRISSGDVEARKKVNEAVKRRLNIHPTAMDAYEKKYPTLAKMLHVYLNFTKLRFDQYKRGEREPEVKNRFNYTDYIRMNHFDAENGMALFNDFPYFSELPESDKSTLFKRFRDPFLLLERMYDTLNTVGTKLDDRFVMLQNGECYSFATLNYSLMPANMSNVFKIVFLSWETLLPVLRKINPGIIEAVYIFCCILWNTSYLDSPISKDGEEVIRRGRLIIHKEMREFYDYDEIQWERIYALRHVLIQTEKCVEELKRRVGDQM